MENAVKGKKHDPRYGAVCIEEEVKYSRDWRQKSRKYIEKKVLEEPKGAWRRAITSLSKQISYKFVQK